MKVGKEKSQFENQAKIRIKQSVSVIIKCSKIMFGSLRQVDKVTELLRLKSIMFFP